MTQEQPDNAASLLQEAERLLKNNQLEEAEALLEKVVALDFPADRPALFQRAESLLESLKSRRNKRTQRLRLIALTLLATAVIAGLSIFRTNSTLIELEVQVSEATIRPTANIALPAPIPLQGITLSNIGNLQLGSGSVDIPVQVDTLGKVVKWKQYMDGNSLNLHQTDSLWSVTFNGRFLRLAALDIPAGSSMLLKNNDPEPGTLTVTTTSGTTPTRGSLDGGTRVEGTCNACMIADDGSHDSLEADTTQFGLTLGQEIKFAAADNRLMAQLTPGNDSSTAVEIFRQIAVDSLRFAHVRDTTDESTIVDVSRVRIIELGGKEVTLQAGQTIKLGGLSGFQVRWLRLGKNLMIAGRGQARKVEIGDGSLLENLMPTWLEWLYANQRLALFMSALLITLGYIYTVLKHLKIVGES